MVGKKGRLTAARSTVSTTRYTSFDKLGRVKGSSQQTGGATHRFRLAACREWRPIPETPRGYAIAPGRVTPPA